jgi:hypothetical protein
VKPAIHCGQPAVKLPIDGVGWIWDGMQKTIIFENEMPEKPHIMQNYTAFAKS